MFGRLCKWPNTNVQPKKDEDFTLTKRYLVEHSSMTYACVSSKANTFLQARVVRTTQTPITVIKLIKYCLLLSTARARPLRGQRLWMIFEQSDKAGAFIATIHRSETVISSAQSPKRVYQKSCVVHNASYQALSITTTRRKAW
jgi:hypothetical protein